MLPDGKHGDFLEIFLLLVEQRFESYFLPHLTCLYVCAGVFASEGRVWNEQRRFTLRHLRDFGFGKNTGEELITNEMKEFIQRLDKNVGKPVSVKRSFNLAILNTLWMIMSGVRYEQDDPRLWSVLKLLDE